MVFINLKDETLFVLLFAIPQLLAGTAAVLLIFLRFFRLMRDRGLFIYSLTGAIQLALMITDIMLLFDHSLVRKTIVFFTGLNGILGIYILTESYKRKKKKIEELRV